MPSIPALEEKKRKKKSIIQLKFSKPIFALKKKKKGEESFLRASVCLRVHVYKHLPVRVCVLPLSCHKLEGRGIEGSPPESCVYLGFF